MRPAGEPKARRFGISLGGRSTGRPGRAGRRGGSAWPTSSTPAHQISASRRLAVAFAAGSAVARIATAPAVSVTSAVTPKSDEGYSGMPKKGRPEAINTDLSPRFTNRCS